MTLHITHVIKRDGQIQEFKKEKLKLEILQIVVERQTVSYLESGN